jgi:shikimate 5-dehydrogenase
MTVAANGSFSGKTRVWFVGVQTHGSSAFEAFPEWMKALGLVGELEGVDIPIGASPGAYRSLIAGLRANKDVRGMVVTAHKGRLFDVTASLLDELDDEAALCREISVVHRRDDRLIGSAIEPRSVGSTLAEMFGPLHWTETNGEILIFGAGGTAAALTAYLYAGGGSPSPPRRVYLVDIREERAVELQGRLADWSASVQAKVIAPTDASATLERLPEGSLIVNATGLGKDMSGAPVPLPVHWPHRCVFWDLNYRGELSMLADARAAAATCELRVYDGWRLFLHGWSAALGCILERTLDQYELAALERAAGLAAGR